MSEGHSSDDLAVRRARNAKFSCKLTHDLPYAGFDSLPRHAIIGGTGLTTLDGLEITGREDMGTPYGEPSGTLMHGRLCGAEVWFLARHGPAHTVPPHMINYRANIWALNELGVENVIAVNAVGGIRADLAPGDLVLPDQIIDYTWSRGHTFFEHDLSDVVHVDFTRPYSDAVRDVLRRAAATAGLSIGETGTYGVTQGPRLETAGEIDRMERDGCDVVGMTGMPEAALARELSLNYGACVVISNRAAGRGAGEISMDEIRANLRSGMARVKLLLEHAIPLL